eukprot:gene4-105_t
MQILQDHFDVVEEMEIGFDPAAKNEVLVFLHDRKVGGTDFKGDLWVNAWRRHKLKSPLIQSALDGESAPAGTHFLPQWANSKILGRTELIAGHYDWQVFGLLKNRKARCLISVRDPVERFISFVLHRSHNISHWLDPTQSPEELAQKLNSVTPENMVYSGIENGFLGIMQKEHEMYLTRESLGAVQYLYRINDERATEALHFREILGPQNSLLRMLDPDYYELSIASMHLQQCLIVRFTEDRENSHRILRAFMPWLHTYLWEQGESSVFRGQETRVFKGTRNKEVELLRSKKFLNELPEELKSVIAKWNQHDVKLYHQALNQYENQLHKIKHLPIGKPTNWPVFRWQLAPSRVYKIKDLAPCAVGNLDEWKFLHHAKLIFGGTMRFPRPSENDVWVGGNSHAVFGDCQSSRDKNFRPAALLTQQLFCVTNAFYKNDMMRAVEYVDEIIEMLGVGRPLARCLDSSAWPFTRRQILLNVKSFHQYAYSPFSDTNLPYGFTWIGMNDVNLNGLNFNTKNPYLFYPHMDVYDGDWIDMPIENLHGVVRKNRDR